MAGPHILFTPVDSSSELDLNLEGGSGWRGGPLVELTGGLRSDSSLSVSKGGKPLAVFHEAYWQYKVQFAPWSDPFTTSGGPSQPAQDWQKLHAWISHTQQGGTFTLRVDNDLVGDETLTNAETEGTTTPVEVPDTSDFSADDWVLIQHADNPLKWEYNRIASVLGGTSVTVSRGLAYDYPAGSVFRHRELFLNCVRLRPDLPPLIERKAGRGANIWDLAFSFRTTS